MSIVQEYSEKQSVASLKNEDAWIPIRYEVLTKQQESGDLVTMTMKPVGDQMISPLAPGQFNMLYAFGVGEIPISVSSLLDDHPIITHTIQDVGAVSKAICSLKVGDQLGVRGAFGTCWDLSPAKGKDVIIMAGGVGIAPLRPLIESVLEHRDDFRSFNILYGTRNPDGILFHKDIIYWQSDPTISFHITVDHAFTHWHGNVGVVTTLLDKADFDADNTVIYICGPEVMMRYGAQAAISHGIPEEQIYISMERNMKCAIGHCGHCQLGPFFVCKDGAVFSYPKIKPYLLIPEL